MVARQQAIQKKLVGKHLTNGCLVLYDLTNIWLEGEYADSDLAAYGRGKGGKHGYKQIAIGLITNHEGCPVAVEVFSGNTSDLRHVLCKTPETMRWETLTRQSLIEAITGKLATIARVTRKRYPQAVCARVDALLGKYKIEEFFNWFVDEKGQLTFSLDNAVVAAEEALDGCYVIRSTTCSGMPSNVSNPSLTRTEPTNNADGQCRL